MSSLAAAPLPLPDAAYAFPANSAAAACVPASRVSIREHNNNRLWFKCNLKLGHLMYDVGDMGRLQRIIKELLR